jgi:hypothetical protein
MHSPANDLPPGFLRWRQWIRTWFEPIDIASLVYFRITFGALMVWELAGTLAGNQVNTLWIDREFHFKYYGFEWVQAPPGNWMYGLFACLLVSAAGMTIGLCYRICAIVFAIGFTWLFLIDQANYLNHFYLISLLGFLSILLPLNRRLALDCLGKPTLRSDIAPAWALWLLRAQMAIVYFYGGIAKLNADWLRGEPVRSWILGSATQPGFSHWFRKEWMVLLISYGGLLFDLLVVPLLLWRKTRVVAFVLAAAFHLANSRFFNIGVFPWLSIAMTALFFPAEWPRRVWSQVRKIWWGQSKTKRVLLHNTNQFGFRNRGMIAATLAIYLGWQLLMPLRHYLYPGFVSWTEEGHRFSWHMMLRSKKSDTRFFILDPGTEEVWALNSLAYLSLGQDDKMNGRPDMILQFAHYIAELMRKTGRADIHIHVIARAGLNGRSPALLIDPDVNLAAISRNLQPSPWILPMENNRPDPPWLLSTHAAAPGGR